MKRILHIKSSFISTRHNIFISFISGGCEKILYFNRIKTRTKSFFKFVSITFISPFERKFYPPFSIVPGHATAPEPKAVVAHFQEFIYLKFYFVPIHTRINYPITLNYLSYLLKSSSIEHLRSFGYKIS